VSAQRAQRFVLRANDTTRVNVLANAQRFLAALSASKSWRVEVCEHHETRSNNQNRKMWAMLNDIARQLMWPINGVQTHITPEDWKDLITAGLAKHQRIAQGIEGGVVMLGGRTSKMTKAELAELIEYIYWFGADRQITWDEAAQYINADQMAA